MEDIIEVVEEVKPKKNKKPEMVTKEEFDKVTSDIGLTSNEHYKNALSLQIAISDLQRQITQLRASNKFFELYLSKVLSLPWLNMDTINEHVTKCEEEANQEVNAEYEEALKAVEENYNNNVGMLQNFLENTKLPEINEE